MRSLIHASFCRDPSVQGGAFPGISVSAQPSQSFVQLCSGGAFPNRMSSNTSRIIAGRTQLINTDHSGPRARVRNTLVDIDNWIVIITNFQLPTAWRNVMGLKHQDALVGRHALFIFVCEHRPGISAAEKKPPVLFFRGHNTQLAGWSRERRILHLSGGTASSQVFRIPKSRKTYSRTGATLRGPNWAFSGMLAALEESWRRVSCTNLEDLCFNSRTWQLLSPCESNSLAHVSKAL